MGYFDGQVVWITGASSGIGEALAYALAAEGAVLILSARREDQLARVRAACPVPERVHLAPLDLAETGDLPALVAKWVAQLGRIDILINNGGMSQRAYAAETSLAVDRRLMEVNYFGPVALTKAVLPHMRQAGGGHIVAVSSITGKFGFPLRSAYAAAKHAMHGFFESLGLELHGEGIRVTLVNPGRIRTEISQHALTADGRPHGEMDPGQAQGMPAEVCARKMLQAIRKGRPEVNIGRAEILMVYFKRYAPWLFRRMARRVSPQ
ncbi:MAG: SDR family oxidoreductase [Bacteroidetes bacterium]|nr:MAG: SDR family oxidoreductase [Bacteroidota bacterium]